MEIRIAKAIRSSFVDGPGERAVLWVQGCTIECPGCQNRAIWNREGGRSLDTRDVAKKLLEYSAGTFLVTITGGEPFQQPRALSIITRILHDAGRHILIYSGYRYEELTSPETYNGDFGSHFAALAALSNAHILVDGPFIKAQDDDLLSFRGSRNQRVIDLPPTIKSGRVVLLDWDDPAVIIKQDGSVLMPAGLQGVVDFGGEAARSAICGQLNRGGQNE